MNDCQEQDFDDSVAATAQLLGDRWTFLILREAFYGVRRFNEFAQNLGVSRNILSQRLKLLVSHGIFEARPYGPSEARYEYQLAQPGRDIFPIVVALRQWGDKYLAGENGPAIVFKHIACGNEADPQLVCRACGEPIDVGDIMPTAGPGANDWVRERLAELTGHPLDEPAQESADAERAG
jgi:DNA-binding HxlR family transcriptional regulator